ncbi:myb-related transcription factor, partner of profilin-like [Rana temporaria]|uniref:myb-related transcription factor, partner of profilin-like n=1 Tax=Rana temporaria TaxID=8407 RepID=UPI001AAE0931|nr:myb-related transcription factor, partner of profilin-like [Rana temporaria]
MSDSDIEKEKRKKNFSVDERVILTTGIAKYDTYLHGAQSGRTSKPRKLEILQRVTLELNTLGHETRTWKEVQKKINDMCRRVREKLAKMKRHLRTTGGGSANVLEGDGPSSASGRPTPGNQHVPQSDPLGSHEASQHAVAAATVEGSAHTCALEVVVEEPVDIQQEDCLYLDDEETICAGPSETVEVADLPTTSTPIRGTPPRATLARGTPPTATPRKALSKTRGAAGSVQEGLEREQAHQTRRMADIAIDLHRVAESLASVVGSSAKGTG